MMNQETYGLEHWMKEHLFCRTVTHRRYNSKKRMDSPITMCLRLAAAMAAFGSRRLEVQADARLPELISEIKGLYLKTSLRKRNWVAAMCTKSSMTQKEEPGLPLTVKD